MAIQAIQDSAVTNFAKLKGGAQFDPAIILVIAEMVLMVIEMLQDCRDPESATDIVNDPTWLQQWIVKMRVRRAMGRSAFREHGDDVVKALLQTGAKLTVEDMEAAYAELG